MDLEGAWRAARAEEALRRTWLDDDFGDGPDAAHQPAIDRDEGWDPVPVPGHWRRAPAFADSHGPLLYRTRFEHERPIDDERWWLRFDGIFYQGDVWLDGSYVGDTEGYFFPHTFEVTDALADRTEHTLGVEITCSPVRDRTQKRSITGSFQHADGLHPEANPGGIWRPVHLERTGPVRIRHLRVLCREANETRATVTFRAVLDAAEATEATLRSAVGGTELVEQRRLAAGENQVEWQLRVDDPELWWPHALGDQPLHDVVVEVTAHGPVAGGGGAPIDAPVSHRVTRRIGLRQVHLRAWVLHVNGERLFLKGASQGPNLHHLAELSADDLRRDVALAKDANLDLLRVHAHISRPELYDAADEAGMLIWQDFPLHRGYARSVRKQAQRQAREAVDLLGHHPSVVLWCAHDEPFTIDDGPEAEPGAPTSGARYLAAHELPSWNKSILDRSVKRAIEQADASRPVIAHSGVLPHPPQLDGTDSHLALGWYRGDSRDLAGLARAVPRTVRFVGIFGGQSVPDSADFCEPERWPDLDWERLANDHGFRGELFDEHVPPADHPTFDSWRRATQEFQADLVRHQVETLRRLKYRPTGGFTQFCLADGWPAIGWSAVDHERRPKLAYAALRDACRPVIPVADRFPAEVVVGQALALDVHVVSDRREELEGVEVRAALRWEGGEQHWRFGGTVAPDTCLRVGTLAVEVPDAPGRMELELVLTGPDAVAGPIHRLDSTQILST